MTLRLWLHLFATALFNPRRAVVEGLYDGRVVKSKYILVYRIVSMLLTFALYDPLAVLIEDGSHMLILIIISVAVTAALEYWLMPRLLLFSLSPRAAKRLTKRERREQRYNPSVTYEICRQIVLFSQLAISVASLPITIISIIYTPNIRLSYVGTIASLIWTYIAICPAYIVSRVKASVRVLICYVIGLVISAIAFFSLSLVLIYILTPILG